LVPDDITERFRTFLKTAFGEEQFESNFKFIEKALGKDIRKFFLKDFYAIISTRYKKRPSTGCSQAPKGSFNALIYMLATVRTRSVPCSNTYVISGPN
jgi:hypothetical protein